MGESKDGGREAPELVEGWSSRGREHFVFCEQSETKYLVICDRFSHPAQIY